MEFPHPPSGSNPTPARLLMEEAYSIYALGFKPLVITAGVGYFAPNFLLVIVQPESVAIAFLLSLVVLSLTIGSTAAVLHMVILIRDGRRPKAAAAYEALGLYGARFIGGALLLLIPIGVVLFVLQVLALPLLIYLSVRLSLFGPAVVLEDSDITDAYSRSWGLLRGLWWRTAGIMFAASAPLFVVSLLVLLIDPPDLIGLILLTAAWGLVTPFVTVLTLLIFEDYRRIAADRDPFGPPPEALR